MSELTNVRKNRNDINEPVRRAPNYRKESEEPLIAFYTGKGKGNKNKTLVTSEACNVNKLAWRKCSLSEICMKRSGSRVSLLDILM